VRKSVPQLLSIDVIHFHILQSVLHTGECFGPQLGYNIPQQYFTNLGINVDVGVILLNALLFLVVLHIIAAVLAFLALSASLFLASQPAAVTGFILSVGTGIVATAMLIVDLVLVIVARNRVQTITTTLAVNFGNGVWMVLAAVICTWAGIILLASRCYYWFGVKRYVLLAICRLLLESLAFLASFDTAFLMKTMSLIDHNLFFLRMEAYSAKEKSSDVI
jgi:hypothetical protein